MRRSQPVKPSGEQEAPLRFPVHWSDLDVHVSSAASVSAAVGTHSLLGERGGHALSLLCRLSDSVVKID